MSENFIELGRRAAACKGWRWMPGMVYLVAGTTKWRVQTEHHGIQLDSDRYPDLTDPATLGCLLALVREVWFAEPGFVCWTEHKRKWVFVANEVCDDVIYGDSEAELLVNALEARS